MTAWLRANSARLIAGAAFVGVVGGLALAAGGRHQAADWLWAATTAMLLVPLTWSVVRSLLRGDVGVDAIALMSMAGALALRRVPGRRGRRADARGRQRARGGGEPARAPRADHARRAGAADRRSCAAATSWSSVPIDDVGADEIVFVRAGEVVPVDGMVMSERGDRRRVRAHRRAAAGDRAPRRQRSQRHRGDGQLVRAAGVAAGRRERLRRRSCGWSRQAEEERAPFVRIADRYAAFFLPATMLVAAVAWAVSRRSRPRARRLRRRDAVPADPGRADRAHVAASRARREPASSSRAPPTIEQLGEARSVLLDKTGTLTLGHPELERVVRARRLRRRRDCCVSPPRSTSSRRIRWRRHSSRGAEATRPAR